MPGGRDDVVFFREPRLIRRSPWRASSRILMAASMWFAIVCAWWESCFVMPGGRVPVVICSEPPTVFLGKPSGIPFSNSPNFASA